MSPASPRSFVVVLHELTLLATLREGFPQPAAQRPPCAPFADRTRIMISTAGRVVSRA
jgi:hypothetical protein